MVNSDSETKPLFIFDAFCCFLFCFLKPNPSSFFLPTRKNQRKARTEEISTFWKFRRPSGKICVHQNSILKDLFNNILVSIFYKILIWSIDVCNIDTSFQAIHARSSWYRKKYFLEKCSIKENLSTTSGQNVFCLKPSTTENIFMLEEQNAKYIFGLTLSIQLRYIGWKWWFSVDCNTIPCVSEFNYSMISLSNISTGLSVLDIFIQCWCRGTRLIFVTTGIFLKYQILHLMY